MVVLDESFFVYWLQKRQNVCLLVSDDMKFFSMDTAALQVCKKLNHLSCFSRETFITIYHKLSIL